MEGEKPLNNRQSRPADKVTSNASFGNAIHNRFGKYSSPSSASHQNQGTYTTFRAIKQYSKEWLNAMEVELESKTKANEAGSTTISYYLKCS